MPVIACVLTSRRTVSCRAARVSVAKAPIRLSSSGIGTGGNRSVIVGGDAMVLTEAAERGLGDQQDRAPGRQHYYPRRAFAEFARKASADFLRYFHDEPFAQARWSDIRFSTHIWSSRAAAGLRRLERRQSRPIGTGPKVGSSHSAS